MFYEINSKYGKAFFFPFNRGVCCDLHRVKWVIRVIRIFLLPDDAPAWGPWFLSLFYFSSLFFTVTFPLSFTISKPTEGKGSLFSFVDQYVIRSLI